MPRGLDLTWGHGKAVKTPSRRVNLADVCQAAQAASTNQPGCLNSGEFLAVLETGKFNIRVQPMRVLMRVFFLLAWAPWCGHKETEVSLSLMFLYGH